MRALFTLVNHLKKVCKIHYMSSSSSNETTPVKSIILVSVETDDEIRRLLIGKQRILYQFEGDNYRTKIWKEGGKIKK